MVSKVDKFKKGYPNLATLLDSDENFMQYRRFGYLQSRILLQRQDELRVLEEQLETLDGKDYYDEPHKLQRRELQGEARTKLLEDVEAKFCKYGTSHDLVAGITQLIVSCSGRA